MQKKILSGLALGAMVLGLGYGMTVSIFQASEANAEATAFSIEDPNTNEGLMPYTLCLVDAIKKRDASVLSGWNTYSDAMVAAYTARPLALETAWKITTSKKDRIAAVKKAWRDFKDARKLARKTFNKSKQTAWNTFKVDRKACPSVPGWQHSYDGGVMGGGVDSQPAQFDR